MKAKLICCFAALILCTSLWGQEGSPGFRARGYKGSASLTNEMLNCFGVETSHGYMTDEHWYFGGGARVSFYQCMFFAHGELYLEMLSYPAKRNNSPILGMRGGVSMLYTGKCYPMFEPVFGWSWGISERLGLSITANLPVCMNFTSYGEFDPILMPGCTVRFEF